MRFSRNKINPDVAVVSAAAVIILLCSVLLYAELTARVERGTAERVGSITFKREIAQRKYASQVIWEDVAQNMPVYANDSIRTAEHSEAVIHFNDGTEISLDENSLVQLSFARDAIDINFVQGAIAAKRFSLEGRADEIRITSGDAVVALEKGDVKITKTEDRETDITVSEGKAEVRTGGEEKTIVKDEKVVITKDAETKVLKLTLKLVSPSPNEKLVSAGALAPVTFSWQPVEKPALLEIARDSSFRNIAVSLPAKGTTATVNLAPGSYYWRLREAGGGEFSDVRKLTILRDQPIQLVSPRQNDAFSYYSNPPIITFSWQKNDLAQLYTLEISRDPDFKIIVRAVETPLSEIAVDGLTESTYYWRVRARNESIASYAGVSNSLSFRVTTIAAISPPSLITPADGRRISSSLTGLGSRFAFSWNADPGVQTYEFALARDREFGSIVAHASTRTNLYVLKTPLEPGTYYWRVGALAQEAKPAYSQPRSLTVLAAGSVTANAPVVRKVIEADKGEKRAVIRFSWTVQNFKGDCRLEFAKDAAFLNVIDSRTTAGAAAEIEGVAPGAYFWRVRLLDDEGNVMSESAASPLYLNVQGSLVGSAEEIVPAIDEKAIALAEEEARKQKESEEAARKAEEEKIKEQKRKEEETARLRKEELERARNEEIARKRQAEELEKKRREELERARNEEIARKRQAEELERKRREQLEQARRIEEARRREQAGEEKGIGDRGEPLPPVTYREKFPGRRFAWRANLASTVTSRVVPHGAIMVVATKNGYLTGISQNGARLWNIPLGAPARSTAAVEGERAYVVTVNGRLVCVDVRTGGIRWTKDVDGPLLYGASPVARGGRVYFATQNGTVYAFDSEGKEIWNTTLDGGVFSSVVLEGDTLYVGTDRQKVYAIDAKDGDVRWIFHTDSRIFTSSPKMHAGMVYIGCYSGTLFAVRADNGRLRWKFSGAGAILCAPVFHEHDVIFGTETGMVYALDVRDGTKKWEFNSGAKIVNDPAVAGKTVLVPSGATVVSLDADTGELYFRERFASNVITPITVSGANAYLGLENGEVVSIRSF